MDLIKEKLAKQCEAIETGVIVLKDVAERIRDLKAQRTLIEEKLEEM